MTPPEPISVLTALERDWAEALGVVGYMRGRHWTKRRRQYFLALRAKMASAAEEMSGRELGQEARKMLEGDSEILKHLRQQKLAALNDRDLREEWFALAGLLLAEECLRASPRRSRRPGLRGPQGNDQADGQIESPLRDLSRRFVHCASDAEHECSFSWPWCRRLTENTISLSHYVVPRARVFDAGSDTAPQSLDDVFDGWLSNEDPKHLLLLGEYGLGKTAACLHLLERLASDPAAEGLVGVYVPLDVFARSRPSSGRLSDLLEHALGFDGVADGVDPSRRVYILDGLDEMGCSATIASIRANLELLRPFLGSGSRVVLTCRTHLFASATELETAVGNASVAGDLLVHLRANHDYLICEMQKLSGEEIEQIIARVRPEEDAAAIWKELEDYYDLQDLSGRPILLGLVLGSLTVLRERSKGGAKLDEADIYDAHVQSWIRREMSHKALRADIEGKLALAQAIALTMYRDGVLTIDRDALSRHIKDANSGQILSAADLDEFDYDTRDASFLSCDLAGSYRFMHGSFLEYFVARAFLDALGDEASTVWGTRWVGREVARFLTQMVRSPARPNAIRNLVTAATEATDPVALWNALHVLSLLDPEDLGPDERALVEACLVPRGNEESAAVVVRQYARVAARHVSDAAGAQLIERVLVIVGNDEDEQRDNNETYVNYYGGADAACTAFVEHLGSPVPKYDRRLHIHVLGQLGSLVHIESLHTLSAAWGQAEAGAVAAATASIRARAA